MLGIRKIIVLWNCTSQSWFSPTQTVSAHLQHETLLLQVLLPTNPGELSTYQEIDSLSSLSPRQKCIFSHQMLPKVNQGWHFNSRHSRYRQKSQGSKMFHCVCIQGPVIPTEKVKSFKWQNKSVFRVKTHCCQFNLYSFVTWIFDLSFLKVIFILENKNKRLEKEFCRVKCPVQGQRK